MKTRHPIIRFLLFQSFEHLSILVLDFLHFFLAINSIKGLVHRAIPDAYALGNSALVHDGGDFLEKYAVLSLNLGELVFLDHLLFLIVYHDHIAFNSVTGHWPCSFEALIVFL
jgi:hypothetical protein